MPHDKHFEPQKVVRDTGVLTILASKPVSHHSAVQILLVSTSKIAPMLAAPQRGANVFLKPAETLNF